MLIVRYAGFVAMVYYRFDEKGLISTVANDTEAMEDISQPREIPVALDHSVRLRCVRAFLCRSEARAYMSGTSGGSGGSKSGFLEDVRAQSETIGVVLILGMVVLGMTAVIGFGAQALDATEQRSEVANAEQAMAQFDSKAAQVALGDSDVQSVAFGQTDSSHRVIPSASRITITHSNFTSDSPDDDNSIDEGSSDDDHEIYNQEDLGTVISKTEGTTIAYQAGGVWRKDENGGSTMISPPEFHYRGGTLTFPVIQVLGDSTTSGPSKATISEDATTSQYPDPSTSYPDVDDDSDSDGGPYDNPVENGSIKIEVQSEYYEAWAKYFRTRTEACVVTSEDTRTEVKQRCNIDLDEFDIGISAGDDIVSAYLITPGDRGYIDFTSEGHTINTRGIEDHSLTRFDTTLVPDETDSADFSNLQWSIYAKSDDQQFEIYLRRTSGNACDNTVVGATVYYSSPDGDSDDEDLYQGWHDSDAFVTECYEANDGDANDEVRLVADFVDDENDDDAVHDAETGDPELEYMSLSQSDLMSFKPAGTLNDTADTDDPNTPKFSHDSIPWEPKSYSAGDFETIDRLINHYISLMGSEVKLTTEDKNSDTVNDASSSAYIYYPPSGRVITFLHVTENGIQVEFN